MRALFNFAIEQYRVGEKSIITENPCNVIKAMKIWNKEQPRQSMIALNDLKAFWKALSPDTTDSLRLKQTKMQCKLCLLTACRDQEIASLQKKHIDFRKKQVHINPSVRIKTQTDYIVKYIGIIHKSY
jgi:integrase